MTARSYATKWPAAFNPDDPTVLSIAAVVDEHVDVSADSPQLPLHTHPTGQLALSVGGLVLATIEEVRLARRLPPHFAPLPRSPRLQAIAMEFASFEKAEWTMEDWAAFAGMSVRTLSRQVQAETGLTFRNWRLQHVLLVSLGQLARETSVEEAALTAGYQNTSAFISAFRQVFGMTPGEYRRTLQGA